MASTLLGAASSHPGERIPNGRLTSRGVRSRERVQRTNSRNSSPYTWAPPRPRSGSPPAPARPPPAPGSSAWPPGAVPSALVDHVGVHVVPVEPPLQPGIRLAAPCAYVCHPGNSGRARSIWQLVLRGAHACVGYPIHLTPKTAPNAPIGSKTASRPSPNWLQSAPNHVQASSKCPQTLFPSGPPCGRAPFPESPRHSPVQPVNAETIGELGTIRLGGRSQ
jgi:hypothetical protein